MLGIKNSESNAHMVEDTLTQICGDALQGFHMSNILLSEHERTFPAAGAADCKA